MRIPDYGRARRFAGDGAAEHGASLRLLTAWKRLGDPIYAPPPIEGDVVWNVSQVRVPPPRRLTWADLEEEWEELVDADS